MNNEIRYIPGIETHTLETTNQNSMRDIVPLLLLLTWLLLCVPVTVVVWRWAF